VTDLRNGEAGAEKRKDWVRFHGGPADGATLPRSPDQDGIIWVNLVPPAPIPSLLPPRVPTEMPSLIREPYRQLENGEWWYYPEAHHDW